MTDTNSQIEAPAGYKYDKAGKLRDMKGHLIASKEAEHIIAGNILDAATFDINSIKKAKQRAAAGAAADMVAELEKISPAISLLKTKQMAKIAIPQKALVEGKDPKRSFVMQIVTKLNSLTAFGGTWAGRIFETVADENGEFVYVLRGEDIDPADAVVRKRGPGKGKANTKATDSLAEAMARSKAHLNGNGEANQEGNEGNEGDDEATKEDGAEADAILKGEHVQLGGKEGEAGKVVEKEEATIVKH